MQKMLLIADDFTGALDTGVKFSEAGMHTVVSTNADFDPAMYQEDTILVLCVPTRHLDAQEAYRTVRAIVERFNGRVDTIFKKTDSALRGNIGAELQAMLDGSGSRMLAYLPALPAMNRVTRGGIQYIDGVPVSRTAFGRDPFEPVRDDSIPDLLGRQCSAQVQVVPVGQMPGETEGERTIFVFDSLTQEDIYHSVRSLQSAGQMKLIAGCAGLAEALTHVDAAERHTYRPERKKGLLVVCGSVNPISLRQMDEAERQGIPRFHLPASFLLNDEPVNEGENKPVYDAVVEACRLHDKVLIDSCQTPGEPMLRDSGILLEQLRQRIAARLGQLLGTLLGENEDKRVMIIGGDTLLGFMTAIRCTELIPQRELADGMVLSTLEKNGGTCQVITKSGGFGGDQLLLGL